MKGVDDGPDGLNDRAFDAALDGPHRETCDKCDRPAVHAMSCTCHGAKGRRIVYRRCTACGGRRACLRQLSAHWTYRGCVRGSIGMDEPMEAV